MPDESQSFASTRARLDEIVSQVRKKDTSLEKSLDLLEEGVRLANQCTELIDHADWEFASSGNGEASDGHGSEAAEGEAASTGDTESADAAEGDAGSTDGASGREDLDAGDEADVESEAESDDEDA